MNLLETLHAIRDEALPQELLEKYRDDLIHFRTDILRSIANLKMLRARFLLESKEPTLGAKEMAWNGSDNGLRLIELKGSIGGLGGEIDSLRDRIWHFIRISNNP